MTYKFLHCRAFSVADKQTVHLQSHFILSHFQPVFQTLVQAGDLSVCHHQDVSLQKEEGSRDLLVSVFVTLYND